MSVPRMGLRMAGVLALAHMLISAGVSQAYFAGGGKDAAKGNDCLIGYDFVDPDQVTQDGKKNVVVCTDCDPSCDLDGVSTINGSCTMAAGVCINQSGVEGCTPPSALDKASAKGKVKGVKGDAGKIVVDVPQLLEGSACGAMVDVVIPVKVGKKGASDGKATLSLAASVKKNKSEGIAARSDKDKLTYVCQPRPEGQACPIATTTSSTVTTTITSTSTTIEPTSTTVASTSTTTTSSSTSTSSTVVSTSTTLVSTSTTVASTSTTEVTTTSTTTTTVDLCGNNTIDPGEQCDGTDLGGATCVSSPSAALLCTPECTLDYSQCPGDTTTSTTTPPSTTSTTLEATTTSTSSTTSITIAPTTSTSEPPTTTTSTTILVTTTTTSTTLPTGSVLAFTTGEPTGSCGAVKSGGAGGTTRKVLNCGGLNVGGGSSTVAEGPTPAGAQTLINLAGAGATLTMSGRTAAQTGSNRNCSDTGCIFGPYLPIANAGTSTCVQNTFASPANGTLDVTTGTVTGGFPLTSTVYLTANASAPCPKCVGGTPGVTNSGTCQPGWTSGVGASPTENNPCTPTDAAGDTYDCAPPPASVLPAFPVNLTPITTGTASLSNAGGLFCPSQANSGAFGCSGGQSPGAPAICPDGVAAPIIDYVEEVGSPAGLLSSGTHDVTLASTFCIPSVGGALGFLINGAANLPGPGATSLPGTLELLD